MRHDAERCFEVQRAASLAALRHIDGDEPCPDEAIRARRRTFPGTVWCLEENHRARRFDEKHGWTPNGATRVVEYPPHPLDVGYSRSA